MRCPFCFCLLSAVAVLALSSCLEEPEKKPVPPPSQTSKIPWNRPIAGQGQGQMGMMQMNNGYRR